jgi:hypothetical protein
VIRPIRRLSRHETPWAARAAAPAIFQVFQVIDCRIECVTLVPQLSQYPLHVHRSMPPKDRWRRPGNYNCMVEPGLTKTVGPSERGRPPFV